MRHLIFALIAVTLAARSATAFESVPVPLELKDGDRVVLIGGTFIERAQRYGWLETAMQLRFPEANFTVRNLGWSADTVFAESRGIFDAPAKGYERMLKQVRDIKPTVIILNYGANEAFKGPDYLDTFITQYSKLIDDLSSTKARFVLVSPLPLWKMQSPLPAPDRFNEFRRIYAEAISELAGRKEARFADMMVALESFIEHGNAPGAPRISEDGVTLTEAGNQLVADYFVRAVFYSAAEAEPPEDTKALREAIIRKNVMYFHHWRPQNVTYLFLFRKHEQGNNAKEIEEFKPIIAKLEERIFELKSKVGQ